MIQPAPFPVCIPVPRLHAALGRGVVPSVGDCRPWNEADQPTVLHDLPLNRAEARACLQDLRTAPPEELSRAVQMAAAEYVAGSLGKVEDTALSAFMRGNSTPAPSGNPGRPDGKTDEQRRLAQRHLLTVWVQEERVLDIVQLKNRCEDAERRLADLLSDPDFAELDELPAVSNASLEESEKTSLDEVRPLLPSWHFVLAQLLPFLPPAALLVVNDPEMAEAVHAAALPGSLHSSELSGLPEGQTGRVHIRSLVAGAPEDAMCAFLLPAATKTS